MMETEEEKEKVVEGGQSGQDDKKIESNEKDDAIKEAQIPAETAAADAPAMQIVDLKEQKEQKTEIEEYKYERKYTPMSQNPEGNGLATQMTEE